MFLRASWVVRSMQSLRKAVEVISSTVEGVQIMFEDVSALYLSPRAMTPIFELLHTAGSSFCRGTVHAARYLEFGNKFPAVQQHLQKAFEIVLRCAVLSNLRLRSQISLLKSSRRDCGRSHHFADGSEIARSALAMLLPRLDDAIAVLLK